MWALEISPGRAFAPPPTSDAWEAVWWGERKGRSVRSPVGGTVPATEWMRVVSSASSKRMSGRIVGMQRAISVLPEPGGPIISTLWPPAAAISSARLALLWPFTWRKSTVKLRSRSSCS